jgi:hypothetical protein
MEYGRLRRCLASGILASCLALPALPAAAAGCLGKEPVAAAQAFYRKHVDFYYADPAGFRDLVTPDLFKVLAMEHACAQGQECALDSDPWVDAQDGDISDPITFTLGDHDGAHATVVMAYIFALSTSQRQPQHLSLKMLRADGEQCWRVDDMITPTGNSLAKYIADWFVKYGADAAPAGGTSNP